MNTEKIINKPIEDIITEKTPTASRAIWLLKTNDITTSDDLQTISKYELKELVRHTPYFTNRVYNLIVNSVERAGFHFKELPTLLSNEIFNLSSRTVLLLKDYKINKLEELIQLSKEDIKNLYRMGNKTYNEILDFVHLHGLSFKDEDILAATESKDILEVYKTSENDESLNFLLCFRSALLRKSKLSKKNKQQLYVVNELVNDRFKELFEEVDAETINEEFERVFGISREEFEKNRTISKDSSKIIRIRIKDEE